MCIMSVIVRIGGMDSHWWNMAKIKRQQQNRMFLKMDGWMENDLNELIDGELWTFRGMAFQICGTAELTRDDLLLCRLQ